MKKIILSAALVGSIYFANAQVGIGTPTPSTSAMLDIEATDKGVLIPRIALTSLDKFAPVSGDQENSLLIYNTATVESAGAVAAGPDGKGAKDAVIGVTPGFYYWNVDKWERIVDQSQLNEVIESQADIAKIKDLLDAAYGSNNLGDAATNNPWGGMVYTPAVGTPGAQDYVAPKFEYVTWDPTLNNDDGGYKKSDITTVITDLINASETKTKIVTINNVQYYLSESFNKSTELAAATTDEEKFLVLFPTSGTPAIGVYKIDVVGGVVNNIEEIFTTPTTIVINEGEANQQTFITVQKYIEYIISENSDDNLLGTMIYNPGTGLTNASFTYILADGTVSTTSVTFSDIVKANQSLTDIQKTTPSANVINYVYNAEPAVDGTTRTFTIDLTADLIQQITNNTDIQTLIKNISNSYGNNVGYTTTAIAAGTPAGQLEIPANSFYYVNENGIKVEIPLNDIVYNGITQLTETQVNNVKNILGDNFSNTTIVKTGDVWTDGKAVYKGTFDAFIKNGTANVVKTATDADYSEITIPANVGNIISITVLDAAGNKLTSSVTDVVTTTSGVKFRVGTGNMYNVIYPGTGATDIKVLIEFSAVVTP